MVASSKKYTLFKAEEGKVPPCAFFLSPQGCRNGDKCKFSHEIPSTKPACPAVPSSTNSISSSDISSESESEMPPAKTVKKSNTPAPSAVYTPVPVDDDPFADPGDVAKTPTSVTPQAKTPKSEKKKRKRNSATSDLFANPKNATVSNPTKTPTSKTPKSNKKSKVDNQTGDFRSLALPIASTTQTPTSNNESKGDNQTEGFRSLDLPVASFSISGTSTPKSKVTDTAAAVPLPPPPEPKYVVPRSTAEGIKWQKAVLDTRSNPRYESDFNFERTMKQEQENNTPAKWIKAKPFGAWCANNPHAIAIDCEMCETKDPVTGASNHKALCRLSVVNATNPDEVLIDTLVKPDWPVKDHRSRINGISKEHLQSVQFTLAHAQAFMMALCSSETVIIGHAVHNDLIALKMEHHCNVDSALLFKVKDEEHATCSLKDLAMGVLKREMPDVHDSVNDARVAMLCIEEGYLKTDGKPAPIVRMFAKKKGSEELFVHRIPKGCKPEHIQNMFLKHTFIQPSEVPKIEFNSDTGKTTIAFSSTEHANLAFKTLSGEQKPDKTGRMQKRVYLRTGGYICVRQMTMPRKSKSAAK